MSDKYVDLFPINAGKRRNGRMIQRLRLECVAVDIYAQTVKRDLFDVFALENVNVFWEICRRIYRAVAKRIVIAGGYEDLTVACALKGIFEHICRL